MGMLATTINSLALQQAIEAQGVKARVLTAIRMEPIGEFYSKWKAVGGDKTSEKVCTVLPDSTVVLIIRRKLKSVS